METHIEQGRFQSSKSYPVWDIENFALWLEMSRQAGDFALGEKEGKGRL